MSIQRGVGAGRGNPPTVDGDMALRWVEPRALKTHTREPGFIFRLCFRLQLPADPGPGRQQDGSSNWVPATHGGDLDSAPGPGPDLAVAAVGVWGVTQWIQALSLPLKRTK